MLTLHEISKRFDSALALDGVSAGFAPGTVHGVLGENGAGKTTLMRIAAGLLRPDDGWIGVGGRELRAGSAIEAARAGIAMVHQHFMLVPTLTVTENCMIGRRELGQWASRRQVGRQIRQLGERVGLYVDPDTRIESLSVGEQQRVEILRALWWHRFAAGATQAGNQCHALILDEPTAVLTPQEVEQLFIALEGLRRDGLALVFISHKLGEVQRICDTLTILRRGRCVYSGHAAGLSADRMAEYMIGSSPIPLPDHPPPPADAPITLELSGVNAASPGSQRQIRDVHLAVRSGEILGIAGVEGSGQDVLAGVVVGTTAPSGGCVLLNGRDISRLDVQQRTAAGVAHIPEDRMRQALVPAMTPAENLLLKRFRSPQFARWGFIGWGGVRRFAKRRVEQFDVRGGSPLAPVRQLSGGNQQKLVLAREFSGQPELIVAHNPTRGLDVAATRFVFDQLLALRGRGAAVLLIHNDLDELLAVADRMAVLYNGRFRMTEWPACDTATIGRWMLGGWS